MKSHKLLALGLLSVFFTLSVYGQNFINHRGQDLFLSGINVAWINYGNDLTSFDSEKWTDICRSVVDSGGNSIRWWIHVDGRSTPSYDTETKMVSGISETALNNLATALDIAANNSIVVSLCLWSKDMMSKSDNSNSTLYRARNELMLTDETAAMAYINNALIPMVEKVKNHTAILCWEIFNEPEIMLDEGEYGPIPMEDIQRFVNLCAGAIHRTDPSAKVSNGSWRSVYTTNKTDISAKNYYSDAALLAAGGDEDGYLDFYMFHYYPNELSKSYSPFHNDYNAWFAEDDEEAKPIIIGEFPCYGIQKWNGRACLPRQTKDPATCMIWLYQNGYSGGWGWQYAGSELGGMEEFSPALDTLYTLYKDHIVVQHDESFNYSPTITAKISDTVLFVNSETISKYLNANDYFTDDPNDVLTYTVSYKGIITAEIDEDGYLSFTPTADETGYGTITIKATDTGGKSISQTMYVLVREKENSADNKLLNAFVTYSSIEDTLYLAYYANDGDYTTRWSTEYEDDQYIIFDMMAEEDIRRIVLNWEWNESEKKGAYGQAYTIEVSTDKETWDTVFSVKQGQIIKSNIVLRKDEEEAIRCRYVKIHFTERATSWGYSLTEVEAFDFDDNANNTGIKINTRVKYQATYVNTEFSYQILRSFFTDNNYDVLTITAKESGSENLPEWLSFDSETYYLTGTPYASDEGSHIITITAEDFFGETKSYDLEIYVWPEATSIDECSQSLSLFPNPCNTDILYITIDDAEGEANISFTDLDGKIIANYTVTFSNGIVTCQTNDIKPGLYIVTVTNNGKHVQQKLIIE